MISCIILTSTLVLSNTAGRFCILDITIKEKMFRLIGVNWPNATREFPNFFRRIELYVTPSKQVILVGDWSAVLDPNLDKRGACRVTYTCFVNGRICRTT